MTPLIRRATRFLTAHVDAPLLGAILLLMALGLIVIFSGSNQGLTRVIADDQHAGRARRDARSPICRRIT